MGSIRKTLALASILVLVGLNAWAQVPPPGGGANAGAPLDGMTSLLLLSGAAYGIKRIGKARNS